MNHKHARIPAPSSKLIEELAHGIHCSVAGAALLDMGEKHEDYEHLPPNIKQYWIEGARAAYAIIAVYGGGEVKSIPDAK